MRCHFVYDEETNQKIFIPGCYGAMHDEDARNCCCPKPQKSFKQFEKEEYTKVVKELTNDLTYLTKEYNQLLRIIQKLTK